MSLSKIIAWLIVGALAGTLAGRLATFSKRGLGGWTHVGLGMLGAVVGGLLFGLLGIDLGLGEIKVTFEDLVSAIIGSLLCLVLWRFLRKSSGNDDPEKKPWTKALPMTPSPTLLLQMTPGPASAALAGDGAGAVSSRRLGP